jgi:hypothetical protein
MRRAFGRHLKRFGASATVARFYVPASQRVLFQKIAACSPITSNLFLSSAWNPKGTRTTTWARWFAEQRDASDQEIEPFHCRLGWQCFAIPDRQRTFRRESQQLFAEAQRETRGGLAHCSAIFVHC